MYEAFTHFGAGGRLLLAVILCFHKVQSSIPCCLVAHTYLEPCHTLLHCPRAHCFCNVPPSLRALAGRMAPQGLLQQLQHTHRTGAGQRGLQTPIMISIPFAHQLSMVLGHLQQRIPTVNVRGKESTVVL